MDKEEPIYKFEGLKKLLTDKGYIVEEAKGYREIENVEVELDDVRNKMEFTDEGIFLNDDVTKSKQQIFLYKRDYYLSQFGKPRYHTHKCEVIQEFINRGRFHDYRRANTDVVMVRDRDDNYIDKEVSCLKLCSYCAKMAISYQGKNSSEFVELLKQAKKAEAPLKKKTEVDIFGYTKDWEKISREFRESHNYTCEKCGITIEDPFDRQFIQVHHKNGDKTDNNTENLICLCIHCHANVDDTHKKNFKRRANAMLLDEFNRKYGGHRNNGHNHFDLPF